MMQRTVPQKISEFLIQRQGRMYCDFCIQERLGLRWRQQVQLVTATLACTRLFEREPGSCCICDEHKHVIAAVKDMYSARNMYSAQESNASAPVALNAISLA
jgi:hypothetical protein